MTDNELKTYLTNHLKVQTRTEWDYVTDSWIFVTNLLLDNQIISTSKVNFD